MEMKIKKSNVCAVLLCAGKGTRLSPITNKIPKALVEVKSKPLIEYKLEILVGLVEEVIIVIGYLGNLIKEKYGFEYMGLKLIYVEQKELLGSGHALICAKSHIKEKFLVLNGDDIYSKEDISKLINYNLGILSYEVKNPQKFGVISKDNNENLLEIEEKTLCPKSNLINIGCYLLDKEIFNYELTLSLRGEYEIIDYLKYLMNKKENIRVVKAKLWLPVNNFEELEFANNFKF